MSAKHQKSEPTVEAPAAETQPQTVVPEVVSVVPVLPSFAQPWRAPKAVNFKKNLTPQLVAMAHEGELLIKCTSEPYEFALPVKGRTESMQPATIVNGINCETGDHIMLICNVMIVNAFQRDGNPITGRSFGLKAADMVADKRYRVIEVIEVELDFE